MLLLRCFGQFQLESNGQTLTLPTRKTAALLAYLALHPEVHAREQVVARFWGDFGEEEARRSLRTALSALRKTLGDTCLLADRETVQFNPAYPLWIDVVALRTQTQNFLQTPDPNLIDLTLYRGDLLDGLYDEWILRQREELRLLYLRVLLLVAQHWRTQGDYTRTIETAQRILALDPAEEIAHQHLIFCYTVAGDRQAARQQYEACVHALREELAVAPAPATVALYRRSQQAQIRSAAAAQSNLPLPLSSFIGRTHEIAKLKTLLLGHQTAGNPPPTRLVTVTGPGGCGKTRLAIQVAWEVLERYADGVWWVELAALREAAQVAQAVARVLDVQQGVQPSLTDVLITNLRHKQALLVLDNCEHLVAACAELAAQLLTHCPALQIFTTSREALDLVGEVSWLAPSLTLPTTPLRGPTELLHFEGTQLFVERATAAQRDFALTAANAPAILQICRQLDGIPLAIELAAVRVKLMSVEQLAARLTGVIGARFDLLTAGGRTVLPRQQTLRATIEWSYDLLTEAEQRLLQQLTVFAGGWSLEAAEAAATEQTHPQPVAVVLARLVDKSLVQAEPQGEVARYWLLETVHQYAYEQLEKTEQTTAARDRHLNYYLQLAEQAAKRLRSPDQAEWLAQLAIEHDNLRAALTWSLESHQSFTSAQLGIALWRFWYIRGYYAEGLTWLQKLLNMTDQPAQRAQLLYGQGTLARRQADTKIAMESFMSSLVLFRALGDQRGVASTLRSIGFIHYLLGDAVAARPPLEEALLLFRALDDQEGIAVTLDNLAYIAANWQAAELLYQESLALRRCTGNLHGITTSLAGLVYCAIHQGNYATAHVYLKEHLQINETLRNFNGIANAFYMLGCLAHAECNDRAAQLHYEKSLKICQETGDHILLPAPILGLGKIALKRGELKLAGALFEQALTLFQAISKLPEIALALSYLARLALAQGQAQRTLALAGAAMTLFPALPLYHLPFEQAEFEDTQANARQLLNADAAENAWELGQKLTLTEAVAYALEQKRL